ncbi:uncharacterized protein LOC135429803 [Drosophila montana]|uniref:uncharacterized protein LOC135429803 n=1 Tax=Drosophila montana TaxID=40370 RepID=UPI00313ADA06
MATALHPVNDVVIDAQVFKRANGYKPWLYKGQFDGCRFLKKAYIPLVIFIFKLIKDYTNLNHPCPYVEAVIFKFTNAVCENHNKTWITVHKCRLRAISRNKTTFNLNLTLNYPVDHPVNVKGQLLQKANGYKPWLFSANIDACRFMKRAYNPVAILVFKLFKEYSNFNHSCPYVGPVIIQDFYLRVDKIPNAMPTGDYLLVLAFSFSKKPQITTKVYFAFVEDLL